MIAASDQNKNTIVSDCTASSPESSALKFYLRKLFNERLSFAVINFFHHVNRNFFI